MANFLLVSKSWTLVHAKNFLSGPFTYKNLRAFLHYAQFLRFDYDIFLRAITTLARAGLSPLEVISQALQDSSEMSQDDLGAALFNLRLSRARMQMERNNRHSPSSIPLRSQSNSSGPRRGASLPPTPPEVELGEIVTFFKH